MGLQCKLYIHKMSRIFKGCTLAHAYTHVCTLPHTNTTAHKNSRTQRQYI